MHVNTQFTAAQEIAAALDSAVAANGLEAADSQQKQQQSPAGAPAVRLQASAVLATSLSRCLAPDVFLRPLADKFAKLTLQLVARYSGWLAAGLAARAGKQSGTSDEVRPFVIPTAPEVTPHQASLPSFAQCQSSGRCSWWRGILTAGWRRTRGAGREAQ